MIHCKWSSYALCVILLLSLTLAAAEPVAIAPEVVSGRIMAYVVNSDGADVYQDVFMDGASLEPVETIAYGTEIDIQTLGLGYCRLRRDSKDLLYVRTSDLSFSNEDFENQLAIVFLKRTKNLPLHRTASASSKTLTKVPDGSYVVVLEKGDEFSRVLYGKYDGYLQNSYLSFRVAWPNEVSQGILRDPNNAKHITTVNLRSADSLNGKKVTTLPTFDKRTKKPYVVTVLQFKGEWAEIETSTGIHGYLKSEWVELREPIHSEDIPTTEDASDAALDDDEEEAVAVDEEDLAPEWEE